MVCSIQKSDFQDLAFFIPKDGLISKILKTIVFVNKIEDAITVEKYLQSRLSERIRNRHRALVVIQLINSNLDANTRARVIGNLWYENDQICVWMEYARYG